ncbi:MAG TPA: hypothetical protein VLI04_09725 [Nocardioidaceae bacterium]|nr:hypothetical protein [Nocardioidaceae bacterium]
MKRSCHELPDAAAGPRHPHVLAAQGTAGRPRRQRERFGEDGAYVVVEDRGRTHAARAPIHETFRVYVDGDGVLRTDHRLCLWSRTVVQLHYKLSRR